MVITYETRMRMILRKTPLKVYSNLKQITKRDIKRVSCGCLKMHGLSLFFTNVDVEHLFQKVANLHDLPSNVTDFTWLYSEHLAKFHRGKCAER